MSSFKKIILLYVFLSRILLSKGNNIIFLGVAIVIFSPYVMGAYPSWFPVVYTAEIVFLMCFRWLYYYVLDWHYFMVCTDAYFRYG
jgi:hypothetical protein